MPDISIVIPTYNHAKLLPKAVKSVLEQTHQNWELILIDDGSTDNTKDVVSQFKDPRITYVHQKNAGVAAAMNSGFEKATSELCAWLDADNYYNTDTFKKVLGVKATNPETDVIYGNVAVVSNSNVLNIYKPPQELSLKKALKYTTGAIPVQPGVFFKRQLFQKVHGFNTKYRIAGDFDFWLKVLALKPMCTYVNETFGNYLRDEKGISQGFKGVKNGLKEMLKITNEHDQGLINKLILIKKYTYGYLKTVVQYLLKNTNA